MGRLRIADFKGTAHSLSRKLRSFKVLFLVGFLKATYALALYNLPGKTVEAWNLYGLKTSPDWLYLFAAWDSSVYHLLAANWYPSTMNPLWAYFPLYPASMRLLGLFGLDLWMAGFLISEITGLVSILVFQKVASAYLNEAESLTATALYFLLPPVFVFTTVIYTESLFLLLSLMTWFAHIKSREVSSAFFASLTSITRPYGLLVLIPLGYDFLRCKKFKNLGLLVFPIAAFIGWLFYGFAKTRNFLAPFAAQSYWNSATVTQIRESIIFFILNGNTRIFQFLLRFRVLVIIGIVFIVLVSWLCIRTWKIHRSLGIYSTTFLLVIGATAVTFIQTFVSLPRFLSLIFPTGLSLRAKKKWLLCLSLGLLSCLDLLGWWMFLFTESFH